MNPLGDRFKNAVLAIIREALPNLTYLGFHEYRVVSFDEGAQTADLTPADERSALPPITAIPFRPNLAGSSALVVQDASVLVAFEAPLLYGPTRPFVAFVDKVSGAFLPPNAVVDASGTVTIGPSASSVKLAGGAEIVAGPTAAHGRPVCYGDSITWLSPGVGAIEAAPPYSVAKVTAQ